MLLINPILKASIVKMGEKELQFVWGWLAGWFLRFFVNLFSFFPCPGLYLGFNPVAPPSYSGGSSKRATGQARGHSVEQWEMDWIFALHCFSSLYIQGRGWGQTHFGVCFVLWVCDAKLRWGWPCPASSCELQHPLHHPVKVCSWGGLRAHTHLQLTPSHPGVG